MKKETEERQSYPETGWQKNEKATKTDYPFNSLSDRGDLEGQQGETPRISRICTN